ncbi:MAG: DUF4190 domain-containing protein [Bacilli bacterium]|nr:DUF4190 domain-containing protein [Bacilli bacterium]
MEEENKVAVEEEQKQEVAKAEEQPQQQSEGLDEDSKFSLITFILAVIGFTVCAGWIIGGIAGVVLGLISLKRVKDCKAVKQPFRTFERIAYPVAIVDIVLGAISAIAYTIKFIIEIVKSLGN